MGIRTTVTLEEDLLKLLRLKAVETSASVSDLLNKILLDAFKEDREDLKVFENRKSEPTISFESFLAQLEVDGKL